MMEAETKELDEELAGEVSFIAVFTEVNYTLGIRH
jgi:hypothetical protein